MAYQSCEETFDVNSKKTQTTQSIWKKLKVHSIRNGKPRWLSVRFQTLIWRPGETVQNLESPGLSGRVDGPETIWTKGTFVGNHILSGTSKLFRKRRGRKMWYVCLWFSLHCRERSGCYDEKRKFLCEPVNVPFKTRILDTVVASNNFFSDVSEITAP